MGLRSSHHRLRRSEICPSLQILETGWLGLEFLSAPWKLAGWLRGAVSMTKSLTLYHQRGRETASTMGTRVAGSGCRHFAGDMGFGRARCCRLRSCDARWAHHYPVGISARKGAYTKTLARVPNPREQRSKQHLAATAEPRHAPTHTKAREGVISAG